MAGVAVAELMEAVLGKGFPFRLAAPGISMTPFICDGDVITIRALSAPLRKGDVVAFRQPYTAQLKVHRILHVLPEGYLIQGDNTSEPDGRIPVSAIIGRVVRVEHKGKQVRMGLGPERVVIARLSQHGWLKPVAFLLLKVLKPLKYCFYR